MKKYIILAMLAIMIALFVFEGVCLNNIFQEIIDQSVEFAEVLSKNPQEIDTEENIKMSQELDKTWDKHKRILHLVHNQNVLNEFEMRLARLNASVRANEYAMALTELEQIYRGAYEQQRLFGLSLGNIF